MNGEQKVINCVQSDLGKDGFPEFRDAATKAILGIARCKAAIKGAPFPGRDDPAGMRSQNLRYGYEFATKACELVSRHTAMGLIKLDDRIWTSLLEALFEEAEYVLCHHVESFSSPVETSEFQGLVALLIGRELRESIKNAKLAGDID